MRTVNIFGLVTLPVAYDFIYGWVSTSSQDGQNGLIQLNLVFQASLTNGLLY